MINKPVINKFYTPLTEEYFKEPLNPEIFIYNSQQWIFSVYYALYKTSKSLNDDNVDNNTLKVLLKKYFSTVKFSPDINIVISYIQKYKEKNNISTEEILVSNYLLQDIYNNKFQEVMIFLKKKYCDVYEKINEYITELNVGKIEKIPMYREPSYDMGDSYCFVDYELTRKCFDYHTTSNNNISCVLFKDTKTKQKINFDVELNFNNNIKRTPQELRYDEIVFNVIQSIYTKYRSNVNKNSCDFKKNLLFIPLKTIEEYISEKNNELTLQQRHLLLRSIFFMKDFVSCKSNLEGIYMNIYKLHDIEIAENLEKTIKDCEGSGYNIIRNLLPTHSLSYAINCNGALIEGIYVDKKSFIYAIPYYKKFIRVIYLNDLTLFENDFKEGDMHYKATKKTINSIPLIIYILRQLKTTYGRKKAKKQVILKMDTLFEYFSYDYNSYSGKPIDNLLKKKRCELIKLVNNILKHMEHGGIIKRYEQVKSHKKSKFAHYKFIIECNTRKG